MTERTRGKRLQIMLSPGELLLNDNFRANPIRRPME